MIKFNTKNAKYLATQWADEASKKQGLEADATADGAEASADEKAENPLESLIALVPTEEGSSELKEETVMEVQTEELKLAEWCVPQPVREIYTCPYPEAEPAAKGVYTVFAWYIDWWQYTDGTPAPGLSQVMYVKPNGDTIDVLNLNGNVKYHLETWIKENEGEEYLQFDEKGNLFMLACDELNDEHLIFRYNPLSDLVDTYKLNLGTKEKVEIRNFTVTKNGNWIFMNVMVDGLKNNVYAMQVNTGADPIAMYTYEPEEKPKEPTWAVSTIAYNQNNQLVYWYVDEYNDPLRPNSGLYVAEPVGSGYDKNAVTRHAAIGWWDFVNVLETKATGNLDGTIPKPTNPDYEAVIKYLKHAGGYNIDDYQFDLTYFKDKTAVTVRYEYEGEVKEEVKDLSKLYAEDDDGKPLADEAALKYLVNTTYKDVYGYPDWCYENCDPTGELNPDVLNDPNNAWINQWIIGILSNDFFMNYWCAPYEEPLKDENGKYKKDAQGNIMTKSVKSGAGGYKKAGYSLPFSGDGMYIQPVFPFDIFIHHKTTGKSFDDKTIDETYLKSRLSRNYNGIIIANDEGTWLLNDVWNNDTEDNDYAMIFKLTDKRGNFDCTQPDGLDKLTFKPRWSKTYNRDETDPWYKKPFAANSKGIAAIAKGGKTVYYHTGDKTVDLLANNTYDVSLIYSFSLSEDTLICNGVKASSGGYIVLSIDLETGTITKLPLEKRVESMLSF